MAEHGGPDGRMEGYDGYDARISAAASDKDPTSTWTPAR